MSLVSSTVLRLIVITGVLLGLCLAIISLVNYTTNAAFRLEWSPLVWIIALLLQLTATTATTANWWYLTNKHVGALSIQDSIRHTGLVLIAKYLPGKIWGQVSRAVELSKNGASIGNIVTVSTLEQLIVLHSGMMVASLLYSYGTTLFPVILAASLLSMVAFYYCMTPTIALAYRISRRKSGNSEAFIHPRIALRTYLQSMTLTSCSWISLCILFFLFADAASTESLTTNSSLQIMAALPVSVIAGFIALFVPGGLGVREAFIVVMCTPHMGSDSALVASLLMRMWSTTTDITLGTYTVAHSIKRRNPPCQSTPE